MNYVNVKILPRPHNIEFKYVGRLIFDINYVECITLMQFTGIGWCNSKGQLHCENGPASIWNDGEQEWCRYGKYYREDGPARIWNNGSQFWWRLNGIYYSEEDFKKEIRRRNELRKRKLLTNTP